jgi:AraC-like DNA-binding protein
VNRVSRLLATPGIVLDRFDHAPGVSHHDPEQETADAYGVNFVESGTFHVQADNASHRLTPGCVFVTTPGLVFSCGHDEEHPRDECLSVSYTEAAVEQLRSAGAAPPRAPVLPETNRRAYLARQLRTCGPGDEARVEALAAAVYLALGADPRVQAAFRADRLTWYAARVDRAKELMHVSHASPLSLTTIAREIGMSPFHFARVFRELEGEPPHRYLLTVRLEDAAARLRSGASVTDACFASGFGSLSHFITTFRRRYGTRPSEVRRPGQELKGQFTFRRK